MPGPNSAISSVDGSTSFKGGVDSLKVTTIQSAQNPDGLRRDQLAFLINGTVRDGGITPRAAWKKLRNITQGDHLYQGGEMYNPDAGNPYLVLSIGGNIFKVEPDIGVSNLSVLATVQSVPTTPPWTVTLRNESNTSACDAAYFPALADAPAGFPIPGTLVTPGAVIGDQFSTWFDELGPGFTPFVVPAVGQTVDVVVAQPFTGEIDSYITHDYTEQFFIHAGGWFSGSDPVDIPCSKTWTLRMKVIARTPAYSTITVPGQNNPANIFKSFFCQAERFLVIQAGDYKTPALIWDGVNLRRSIGINNNAVAAGTPGVNEIPPAGPMDFYMNRLWYAERDKFSAGDISGGNSGTAAYDFRDAVLNVTENPLVLGGDGFRTPQSEGYITALAHNASQDAALGQGRLFAFTNQGAHALTVPVTRTQWIAADANNQPLLVPIQLAKGTSSDRSVVAVNGDLYYMSQEPHIRSLITAVRQFNQRGNVPVSSNMQRLLKFCDRELMQYTSGILFDNRLIYTTLPILSPQGAVHQSMMAVDFAPISSFTDNQDASANPVWEGMYEGLDVLELFAGTFDGKERAFAVTVNRVDKMIELWELTYDDKFDGDDKRIQMVIEFPAFTWGEVFALKQQIAAELWIDRLFGETVFTLEYRPDGETCWLPWYKWTECTPRNSCENTAADPCSGLVQVQCYPATPLQESYVQTLTIPKPPESCARKMGRPSYQNYQCQVRLTVLGFCRIRGLLLHAKPIERQLYANMR